MCIARLLWIICWLTLSTAGLAMAQTPSAAPGDTTGLAGRVVDASERPVIGAKVHLTGGRWDSVATGAEGRFEFREVPSEGFSLLATADGYQPSERLLLSAPRDDSWRHIELVLQPGATLTGRISYADGRPAAGAGIGVRLQLGETQYTEVPRARTAEDGGYRLEGVGTGRQTVSILRPGSGAQKTREIEIEPGLNELDVVLEQGYAVSGRVLDAAAEPVMEAVVSMTWGHSNSLGWGNWDAAPSTKTTTDANGAFRLTDLEPRPYKLSVESPEHAPYLRPEDLHLVDTDITGLEVVLEPSVTLSGRLSGLSVEDLSGARVTAWSLTSGHNLGVAAQADGTYRLSRLFVGTWKLLATVGEQRVNGHVVVEPGTRELDFDFDFAAGSTLAGRVVVDGEPGAGFSIQATSLDSTDIGHSTSDDDGSFQLTLAPGRYWLNIVADPKNSPGLAHQEIVELENDREIRIDLRTRRIAGVVTRADSGAPLPEARVLLSTAQAKGIEGPSVVKTDPAGFFEFVGLASVSYRLTALKKGHGFAFLPLSPGEKTDALELRLAPTERLVVELLPLSSGRRPQQALVQFLDDHEQAIYLTHYEIDEAGRFEITELPFEKGTLILTVLGFANTRIEVEAGGEVATVALVPEAVLEVEVPALFESTAPAVLRLENAQGQRHRSPLFHGKSGMMLFGRGKVEHLPRGEWSLTATAVDGRSWSGRATMVVGQVSRAVLEPSTSDR